MKMEGVRKHHLLFSRNSWDSQQATMKLRRNTHLIFPMHDEQHNALHKAVPTIPLLDHITANKVAQRFEPVYQNKLASVEGLLWLIDEVTTSYNACDIQRELGAVVIHAIDKTLPFIREGYAW